MKESDIQSTVMLALAKHPKIAWAYVTTTGKVKGRGGHWMTLGYPGMADIIGQTVTGVLVAIEVKQPGQKPTESQKRFLELVSSNGGLSGWCTSVDQALEIVRAA